LEAVVFTYIVSQILTSEEKKTLKELFQELDRNHDGVISSAELRHALVARREMSEERINFLVRIIDTNGSGEIDYTEFIVAALEPNQLTSTHFEQAFSYFDIDHSGVITYEEIVSFLEDRKQSEEDIRKIFKDLDENHDGEISKEEFLKVLTKKSKERIETIKKEKERGGKKGKPDARKSAEHPR
jgi:calcium-dependent protein kinase